VWRETMDLYFPNSAWIRLRRETLDALRAFQARAALPGWDATLEALLERAGEPGPQARDMAGGAAGGAVAPGRDGTGRDGAP
jgi:hypothetical protein